MALKLPDSAVPMGDFPVAKAVDIDFNDGENLQEKLDNGTLGGGGNTNEVVKKTDITDTIDINGSGAKIPTVKAIYDDVIEGKEINQTVIDTYGTEILKYPLGVWRIGDDSISNKFSDLPVKTSGRIEITSIDADINKNPWDYKWSYRVYNFESYNGMNYFRKLSSEGTAGVKLDTGWLKIATQKDLDDLFQSVSSGKTLVANAITGKGVSTATNATFATMATNISKINTNGYKEETVSWDKTSTGTNRIVFTFSADVYGVKQITPPSDASSNIVPDTSTSMFTINGRKLTLYVNGRGTWEVTAIVRNA